MSYFDLFNLPEQFDIDLKKLKSQYQLLQKMTHPDRFASATDQQKRLYLQKNADVNNGYSVLSSPVTRGEHILENRGFELADEQQTMGDSDFLMQQMMLREQLSEAQSEPDFSELEHQVIDLTSQLLQKVRSSLEQHTPDANAQAAQDLNKLKFLIKLGSESNTRKDHLLDL